MALLVMLQLVMPIDGMAEAAAQAGCSPRPPIRVQTTVTEPGRLRVVVTPGAGGVSEIRFGPANNALIDIGGQTGTDRATPRSRSPERATSVTFSVRQAAPGAATVPLVVIDGCGEWPTFVGGGERGWTPATDPATERAADRLGALHEPGRQCRVPLLWQPTRSQTGVSPGTIKPEQVAVLRGQVTTREKQPLLPASRHHAGPPELARRSPGPTGSMTSWSTAAPCSR